MTPFEKWCEENGYDPKGEFELIVDTPLLGKGDVVTLAHDDSTNLPQFNAKEKGCRYLSLRHLAQHKTEPKMTEQKQIPRMVEVRQHKDVPWRSQELLADLSEMGLEHPYICRSGDNDEYTTPWKYMREIPQPKTRPMTPRELLDAIRGGAVWRYEGGESVCAYWYSEMRQDVAKELCYDWHGTDSDIWVKAEVTE